MAPVVGSIWAPIAMRALRHALKKIKIRVAEVTRLEPQLQPILVRTSPRRPVHPIALHQQAKGRWYTTHSAINAALRRYMSTEVGSGVKFNRVSFPKSATGTAVSRSTLRAPFASTLRPNLTGGAIPRTAGGYTLGGSRVNGVRNFSHMPAAPAQVVNNVSAAMRAFLLSGSKAQFDGTSPSGEKKYRRVSSLQEETGRKMQSIPRNTPGSYIDFPVNPTVTALTPFGTSFNMQQQAPNLNTYGFLDVLSVDFARALKDLATTINDLKKLSSLGNLPITLEQKSILRIRFPGCDAETVERLCDEVGVQRGIIHQDEAFDRSLGTQMALRFPFAPSSDHTLSSPGGSLRSQSGHDFEELFEQEELEIDNPWIEGYESMDDSHGDEESAYFTKMSGAQKSEDFEGLEGIYRFIEECDRAPRI